MLHSIVEQLIKHEGIRYKPYRDTVGKLTIGVGRNLDDVGLSDDEVQYLLINDIKKVQDQLNQKLPWWSQLNPVRQKVLLDMAFNMGIDGLLGFKNTLGMIQRGDYAGAAQGMLASKWAKQVGKRAERLAKMMETGEDYSG
jgi:lysozyme